MLKFKRIITTIDVHTAGEPLRIITSGFPRLSGASILEQRQEMLDHYDHLRTLLMLEPRGHSGMYGCLITPPPTPDGDLGVIFMHNQGYSTMCGHGILAVAKVALETGLVPAVEGTNVIRIDAPAGRITAYAKVENGDVVDVSFDNVPSFVFTHEVSIDVAGLGPVQVDIAFGGAFYVYVDAARLNVRVEPGKIDRLVALGEEIKHQVMARMEIVHPLEPKLHGIYGTIICEPIQHTPKGLVTRNVCIFADAQIDRSPTGTGTSGRLALLHAQGRITAGEILINHSVIDTVFWGVVKDSNQVGPYPAVMTQVGGAAHIMGYHQFVLEPNDPLPKGFRITGG